MSRDMVDLSVQLKQIISDMVFQLAALMAENEKLRTRLAEAERGLRVKGSGNAER
jgi:regulator of replication initiation timing